MSAESIRLSPGDPSSHSRPDLVRTTHLHLDLEADFLSRVLHGRVVISVEKLDPTADSLILDAKNLTIVDIYSDEGPTRENLTWSLSSHSEMGDRLEVKLPDLAAPTLSIVVEYRTSPQASALQWLRPAQTAGGTQPYLFSQCQAIHARSMVPCQDSSSVKAPYSATIVAPANLTVLMSAVREGETEVRGDKAVSRFVQKVPIPSYLLALAIGALESRQIGPRSAVWAERELIEEAALDFSQTESFLQTAEELSGPYVWGRYDILVLPPSFPYGNKEFIVVKTKQ